MDLFETVVDHYSSHAKELRASASARFFALRNCNFFQPMPDEALRRLADIAQIKTFDPETRITSQDEEMQALYVLLYGSTQAFRNGKLVGTIENGDCFGEGIFFTDGTLTTSATVIADDKIIAAEFNKEVIAELQADPQLMVSMDKALLLALFKKLQGANLKIERLMLG